ncbi:Exotoxin [Staphylococcus agnetis]|uniref:exotoxin beta-grasp domain-containing protein n=1 Tax=Staphylococcus agnetis TaxID=985762 RepID=UPI000E057CD3|nr:superantigen-like protein [Staphylococcus agnetis]SUK02515.1 Exotoxin [Staphylococcus agnetis]
MKLSTIAKTSLALGILTTGVITTNAQPVDAAQQATQKSNLSTNVQELLDYYNKPSFDHRNVKGYKTGNKVEFVDEKYKQPVEVTLAGGDKTSLKEGDLSDIDVFVVREDSSRQVLNNSIGGVTKSNSQDFKDYVAKPELFISKDHGDYKSTIGEGPHLITKEEISLKELDFKLRKHLIDNHGLYSKGNNKGDIIVKMKGDNPDHKYTFELDKKLQDHRMGDVVNSKDIKEIIVEFK